MVSDPDIQQRCVLLGCLSRVLPWGAWRAKATDNHRQVISQVNAFPRPCATERALIGPYLLIILYSLFVMRSILVTIEVRTNCAFDRISSVFAGPGGAKPVCNPSESCGNYSTVSEKVYIRMLSNHGKSPIENRNGSLEGGTCCETMGDEQ
jgi:hypothetical protein